MTKAERKTRDSFIYAQSRYRGKFTPENLAFNANLQEFSQKLSYISALHTGGKLSSETAYKQVASLWQKLEQSKHAMKIGIE
jgi:hypothetical protein